MIHVISLGDEGTVLNNLGTGDTCSVSRIAEIVIEESGLEGVSIDYTGGKRGWAGDVPKTYLDVSKLLGSGFEHTSMSEQAVRDTASADFRDRPVILTFRKADAGPNPSFEFITVGRRVGA